MKKILYFVAIITLLFTGIFSASAQQNPTQVTAGISQTPGSGLTPCTDTKSADCYQLLEPLPQKQEDGTYKYVDNFAIGQGKDNQGIAGFINFMFEIGIGIAGVLGVVMLTIYGFQYASNDKNINTFAELKTKITNVIFGILLLLGIFIILRTINPDLLIVEPEIKMQYLQVDENETDPDITPNKTYSDSEIAAAKNNLKVCVAGLTKVQGEPICKSIAPKVEQMLAAAKAAGSPLIISSAFRTYQEQVNLRKINGCPDIYKSPATSCRTATAIPGTSRHENGLAIDFKNIGKCPQKRNGRCINANSKEWRWLEENAKNYGLKPLAIEAWHWSIDGR